MLYPLSMHTPLARYIPLARYPLPCWHPLAVLPQPLAVLSLTAPYLRPLEPLELVGLRTRGPAGLVECAPMLE